MIYKKHKVNRRERLLMYLIGAFALNNRRFEGMAGAPSYIDPDYTHFTGKAEVGDLVMTASSIRISPNVFSIGWLHQRIAGDEAMIRDIFTGALCRWGNEDFWCIHNVPYYLTLDDKTHAVYTRFNNAIRKVDRYGFYFRSCGCRPMADGVVIWTRRKWGVGQRDAAMHYIPWKMKSGAIQENLCNILLLRGNQ